MGDTRPGAKYFFRGLWGWDSSQWQKLALLFGYTDRLAENASHTKVGAGNYTLTISTVPSGYIYVVNAITSNNATTAVQHQHQLYAAAAGYTVHAETPGGAGQLVVHSPVNYVLKAGDSVRIYFISCLDGDYLVGRVWGYKMAVS